MGTRKQIAPTPWVVNSPYRALRVAELLESIRTRGDQLMKNMSLIVVFRSAKVRYFRGAKGDYVLPRCAQPTRCLLILLAALLLGGSALGDDLIGQRADGCIVMDAGQANSDGDQLDWTFELKHSGSLTLQLISSLNDADTDLSTTVEVNGESHAGTWEKVYLIEDGLVWQCSQPIEFAKAGSHTLSFKSQPAAENSSANSLPDM